ncbi:glycine oxidase ThiO, partial [Streptomyces sp. A7024]|nr:glycine oxidase ThiO [Streptomyces coryli]
MAYDVVIAGGGVIGLGIAWQAGVRGLRVAVADPAPGSGATHTAAGLLTPVGELAYDAEPLLRLGIASRLRYPSFIAELEELTGADTGYRADGILEPALDDAGLAYLEELRRFQASLGVASRILDAAECRELEPGLTPRVRGGLLSPEDGSIDPRRLVPALLAAALKTGTTHYEQPVAALLSEGGRAAGVRLADGREVRAGRTVLAAGSGMGAIDGVPPGVVPTIRPVKGQTVRLRAPAPYLGRGLRGVVDGSRVYVVSRSDGELVIGATQEDAGYDTTASAGAVRELLTRAEALLPGIEALPFTGTTAGLRPASPDDAPVVGPTVLPDLVVASGHFRNGVLLAPVTADVVVGALVDGRVSNVG